MKVWRNAGWLAGREARRAWLSYPATALCALLCGFVVVGMVDIALQGGGPGRGAPGALSFVTWYLDALFLGTVPLLAGNFVSRDYLTSWGDSFSKRLSFLRGLPIAPAELVLGRALSMVGALALTVPAFFVPPYLLSRSLAGRLEPAQYLWFVAMWVGYALLAAGLYLYLEMGTAGKTYNLLMAPLLLLIVSVVGFAEWFFDAGLVERTVGLAERHGPIAALVALLVGAGGLALWAWATARRLQRRELA